jgi:hypothetical protein
MSNSGSKLLALFGVVSLAANVWFYRELQAEKSKAAEAVAQAASTRDSPQSTRGQSKPPPGNAVEPASSSASSSVSAPIVPANAATTASVEPKTGEECERLRVEAQLAKWRDPAERDTSKSQQLTYLKRMDGKAAEELGLSTEQMNRLFEIQVEQTIQSFQNGWSTVSSSSAPEAAASGTAAYQTIAAEFGNAVAHKWADYQYNSKSRLMVKLMGSEMANADLPFTAEQRKKMVVIYTDSSLEVDQESLSARMVNAARPRNVTEYIEQSGQNRRREAERQRRLQEAASDILSDKQLMLLRQRDERSAQDSRDSIERMRNNPKLFEKISFRPFDSNGC